LAARRAFTVFRAAWAAASSGFFFFGFDSRTGRSMPAFFSSEATCSLGCAPTDSQYSARSG